MNLTEQDYEDFVAIVAGVLADNGVPQADDRYVLRAAAPGPSRCRRRIIGQ